MHKAALKWLALSLILMLATLVSSPVAQAATTGNVQGVVRGENGQPLQGARVSLEGAGGGQRATTDKNGTYSFLGLGPGTYNIRVALVTYEANIIPVTVTADTTQNVDFALTKRVISGSSTVRAAQTRRNDTQTTTTVSARDEQREKSQPNNLYQSTGLLNFRPGVTTDAGQYPHLRGSDGNQIQWMVDGINVRDPITNQFATNLVTVGIRSSNVVTGGATADYGGATGGFLNQLTVNGRDLAAGKPVGGYVEDTNGPGSKWGYSGATTQVGGVLLDNKLDYALAAIAFRTKYGDNTQLGELHSSHDESGKINYYADPNNTFTLYFTHGAENYNNYQTTSNNVFFDPDTVLTDPTTGRKYLTVRTDKGDFNDHNVQTHNLDHFTFKHNFTPSSFLQYRIYQLHQADPYHDEGTGSLWGFDRTNTTGNQLDYSNQLSRQNILRIGSEYLDSKGSFRRQVLLTSAAPIAAEEASSDRVYPAYPTDFSLYVADQLRTKDNKGTLDLGVRFNNTKFNLTQSKYAVSTTDNKGKAKASTPYPDGYTTKSTDPRLGLGYSPSPDLTFRTSYGVTSQRPDMRRIERVGPEDFGDIGTSLITFPLAQSRSAFNAQGYSEVKLTHSKDYDLGVEKAFNVGGPLTGQYTLGVTTYKKREYGLTYQTSADYATLPAPTTWDNEGTAHASGLEVLFRKAQRRPSDWNGFLSYTNQVVRSNVSLYDTVYTPYFSSILQGNGNFADSAATPYGTPLADGTPFSPSRDLRLLNKHEFATSWDQRHTVAVVAGKRFNNLLESTFILDAGSGLPFFAGGTADGNFGSIASGFGELSQVLQPDPVRGGADFTQVPISLGGSLLPPVNPVVGYTGWHYKISVNSDFHITKDFSLFLNVDNVFDKKTALSLATGSFSGEPYYNSPSPQYPQGQEIYKYQSKLTPIFMTFGFRQRF